MSRRNPRIIIHKEFVDELDNMRKQIMLDLNVDITRVDASRIFAKKIKQQKGDFIIKKGVGRKRGKISIV